MTQPPDVPVELSIALELAAAASDLLLRFAARGVVRRNKSGKELVSEADLSAQALIVAGLRLAFPDDALVAEEVGGSSGSAHAERCWYIDPLDGTTNFLKGQPRWGTSIAFYGPDGAAGVVTCPPLGDTYHGSTGVGAFLNDEPISCSDVADPEDAVVTSGFPYDFSERTNLEEWTAVTPNVLSVRSFGAAAIDLCDVASGRSDAFWEQRLGLWDTAAGMVIAAEAGAVLTDLHGAALNRPSQDVLAANSALHPRILAILRTGAVG